MGADKLSSRAVIGEFYKRLTSLAGQGWVNGIANYFTSDQASETYPWLGQSPAMREWLGGRDAKGFTDNSIEITNKHFEATLKILARDMRRDKTGQINARIAELTRRTTTHWASLLSTLILNGASTACYDGQFFFDTDHSEGDSGTQSNDLSIDISALPVATGGTTTAPSVAEFQLCIAQAIQAIVGFKDDQGEPMNEDATDFIVMVPTSLMNQAIVACNPTQQVAETQTVLTGMQAEGINISPVVNPRLNTWTANFAVFRTDAEVKAFIRQEETGVQISALAEGSDHFFKNDEHLFGVDAWRNAGYGYWQQACLVTMT